MDSLTDPTPLDPKLATETHQAEERERAAFVVFMLLAIFVLLGFGAWRLLFGGPEWKPATEAWMQVEGVDVPMPDPWAALEKETTRTESGDEITEASFLYEKSVLLEPLAARWEQFLVEHGYTPKTEVTGNGETRRIRVVATKPGREVEIDLRTWDRSGKLKVTKSAE